MRWDGTFSLADSTACSYASGWMSGSSLESGLICHSLVGKMWSERSHFALSYQILLLHPLEDKTGDGYGQSGRGNSLQMFYAWSGTICDRAVPSMPCLPQKMPVPPFAPGEGDKRSLSLRLSRCSCSVNSGTSRAVTVIVTEAGFSGSKIFSCARSSSSLLSLVEAEVVFLRLIMTVQSYFGRWQQDGNSKHCLGSQTQGIRRLKVFSLARMVSLLSLGVLTIQAFTL